MPSSLNKGLEKLDGKITKAYFKSTNHHNRAALDQMMLKFNRLETLIDAKDLSKLMHALYVSKRATIKKTCTLHK